jgi:SAM-dependent methyltransferase
VVLDALPDRCERALDIGCGEGTLARKLAPRVAHVTAIDADAATIELARGLGAASRIEYLLGDFLAHPFEPGSLDFVACVAALHQMDEAAALRRMRELLRAGGVLVVIGLARSRYPADLPRDCAAAIVDRAYRLKNGYWESPAPIVWPPPRTYPEIRSLVGETLPGARCRRRLLWRYSVTWAK